MNTIDTKGMMVVLNVSQPAIHKRALKEGWIHKFSDGQGKGGKVKQYLIDSLPPEIQTAIRQKQAEELAEQGRALIPKITNPPAAADPEAVNEAAMKLNGKQRAIADARCAVCAAVVRISTENNISMQKAIARFLEDLKFGRLDEAMMKMVETANARQRAGRIEVKERSLKDWLGKFKSAQRPAEMLLALAPAKTREKVPATAHNWLPVFMRFHNVPQKPKLAHSYRRFADWWREHRPGEPVPSESKVWRVWNAQPAGIRERGRNTGAALKAVLPYVKRDWTTNLKPNDVWVIDGHSHKGKVRSFATGKPVKPEVTVVIDGCSRMVVGWSIGLAESAAEVMNAMRHGVSSYGNPLLLYSDNGAGETALKLDHETLGVFTRLGIRHETGIPGNPRGRGIIERWWKDNLIRIAGETESFVGKQMDNSTKNLMYRKMESAFNALDKGKVLTPEQQKVIGSVPSWAQFEAAVAQCVAEYNAKPHRSLPKKADGEHFSPAEYREYRMVSDGLKPDFLSSQELELMFRPQEERIVDRGWVNVYGNMYFDMALANYHGEKVRVSYDMHNAEFVMVFDQNDTPICKAKEEGNTRDAFPKSVIEQQAEKRAAGKIKRAQKQIALAKAELNPAIEQAKVLDELFMGGFKNQPNQVIEGDYEVIGNQATGTDDNIYLFNADR